MKKEVINCFHPKYVQTYMPELITKLKMEETQKFNGIRSGILARTMRESDGTAKSGTLSDIQKIKKISLEPTTFHIYSRAGTK